MAELCILKDIGIFFFKILSYFSYYYYFILAVRGAHRLLLLGSLGSRARGLSSYSTWTSLVVFRPSSPASCGIPVPQTGIEPTSPALESGFITAGLQGVPTLRFLKSKSLFT